MNHRLVPLLALLAFAFASLHTARAADPAANTTVFLPLVVQPGAAGLSADEQAVFDAINGERAKNGCPALAVSAALQQAASTHSLDMAVRDYFSHTDPDGKDAATRARSDGYTSRFVGENIAAGQPTGERVAKDWMNSETHRNNILNCTFTETGVALVYQPDDQMNVRMPNGSTGGPFRYYWTQMFGNPNL